MLRNASIIGVALLVVGLVGCQGTDFTDNSAAFRTHINQRLDRVAHKLDRLALTGGTGGSAQQTFVARVRQDLARTRRELSRLGDPGGEHYARMRRRIRRDTDELEYQMDRAGS